VELVTNAYEVDGNGTMRYKEILQAVIIPNFSSINQVIKKTIG
jgi:hypothetical protein